MFSVMCPSVAYLHAQKSVIWFNLNGESCKNHRDRIMI